MGRLTTVMDMSEKPKYYDLRADFFKSYFEKGQKFADYIANSDATHAERWKNYQKNIALSSQQKEVISSFVREMNILVMSGIWCGDCARQGPMLAAIEEANPKLSFRFLDNRENPELQDELKMNGANKVPVIVVLSEDFFEVSRFGDKHLSVYRKKVEKELGPACDAGILPPSNDELGEEVQEWLNYFERLQHMLRLAPALRKRHED